VVVVVVVDPDGPVAPVAPDAPDAPVGCEVVVVEPLTAPTKMTICRPSGTSVVDCGLSATMKPTSIAGPFLMAVR